MIKNLFRLGIIAVLAAACQGSESSSHKLALYSRYLLSDTTQTDFRILSSCGKVGRMGKIYVLGEPDEARSLSSFLLTCDQFNNVDGHARPDGLLDFAGEDFCAILDELHAPYGSLVASGHKDSLTALTIRNFISAVDTTYYLNSYDVDKLGRKKSAKMVVLASSHVSSYGYFDIDSLCQIAGCNIPLVTPLHAMLDEAWTKHGKGLNIGIWSSDSTGLSGVYADVMASEKRLRGDALAEYSVISPCAAVYATAVAVGGRAAHVNVAVPFQHAAGIVWLHRHGIHAVGRPDALREHEVQRPADGGDARFVRLHIRIHGGVALPCSLCCSCLGTSRKPVRPASIWHSGVKISDNPSARMKIAAYTCVHSKGFSPFFTFPRWIIPYSGHILW